MSLHTKPPQKRYLTRSSKQPDHNLDHTNLNVEEAKTKSVDDASRISNTVITDDSEDGSVDIDEQLRRKKLALTNSLNEDQRNSDTKLPVAASHEPALVALALRRDSRPESNMAAPRNASWSPDGTCIITNHRDKTIKTFVLPPDLLESDTPHHIEPYHTTAHAESVIDFSVYPGFDLTNPATTLFVSGAQDHPIKMHNALAPGTVGTYPLINPTTESYICPYSLQFARDGATFVAGSANAINVFDVSRSGDPPTNTIHTIPSARKKIKGGGVGMKGIVSALAINCDDVLAAGTFTGWVGLYPNRSYNSRDASYFCVYDTESELAGNGIMQTFWSPCGRFLYVAPRKSDGILVYDVRDVQKPVTYLTGRKALTNERMTLDIVADDSGHHVWGGGTDGCVRIWSNPHLSEGPCSPVSTWEAHDHTVSSVLHHPSAKVVSTCSGNDERFDEMDHLYDSDELNSNSPQAHPVREIKPPSKSLDHRQECVQDNSFIKVWAL